MASLLTPTNTSPISAANKKVIVDAAKVRVWAKEFSDFALKGDVVNMAAVAIVGLAFSKVVTSLIVFEASPCPSHYSSDSGFSPVDRRTPQSHNDIIMPPLGLALSGVDVRSLVYVIRKEKGDGSPAVVMRYGLFLNTLLEFLIIAVMVFFATKAFKYFQRHRSRFKSPSA